jgi:hypothetical protein
LEYQNNNGKQEDMEYTDKNKTTLDVEDGSVSISFMGYRGARFYPDAVQKVSVALDLVGRELAPQSTENAVRRAESQEQVLSLRREAAWRLKVIEEYEKQQAGRKRTLRTSPEALRALEYRNSISPKESFTSWDETGFDDDTVSDWIRIRRETWLKLAQDAKLTV